MDLDLRPEDDAFRAEVRAFLEEKLTPELRLGGQRATSVFIDKRFSQAWNRILADKGWSAPGWPIEQGGTGWSILHRSIFDEECARAGAPSLAPHGLKLVGPAIIEFGTPEQKAEYLPGILSGDDYWCQGYSEPGAGSDLAALSLRAETDGNHYVLNGSKIWTTHAHWADRIFCLVRSRLDGKPQAGITFLLFDMDLPGITVRPVLSLTGEHELNEVFFEDVRVPKSGRLGPENEGWGVAKYVLGYERGGGSAPLLRVRFSQLLADAAAGGLLDDPALRRKLAEAAILVEAIGMSERRVLSAFAAGQNPGPVSSQLKVQGVEAMQSLDVIGLELLGGYGAPSQREALAPDGSTQVVGPEAGPVEVARYFNGRAASIYGGSNEIQRNIMAKMLLKD